MYIPPYYNNYPQYPQQQQSSVIHVQSEAQAREWSVTPGASIMFIDDTAPYCYTKSLGFSQFEPPVFKRFRITEESAQAAPQAASEVVQDNLPDYITKAEFEPFKTLLDELAEKVKELEHEPIE